MLHSTNLNINDIVVVTKLLDPLTCKAITSVEIRTNPCHEREDLKIRCFSIDGKKKRTSYIIIFHCISK